MKKILILFTFTSCTLTLIYASEEGSDRPEESLFQALNAGDASADLILYKRAKNYEKTDPEKTLEILTKLAQQPNKENRARALIELGCIYFYGNSGLKKDLKQALAFLLEGLDNAAPTTSANISFLLGRIYEDGGDGIAKDPQKAREYFTHVLRDSLIEDLKVRARFHLATLESEEGKSQSEESLFQTLKTGNIRAFDILFKRAEEYEKTNPPKTVEILTKLAQHAPKENQAQVLAELGSIYFHGDLGQKKDFKKALSLLLAGLENATPGTGANIAFLLGRIYKDGGDGVTKDHQKAREYFMQVLKDSLVEELKTNARSHLANLESDESLMQALDKADTDVASTLYLRALDYMNAKSPKALPLLNKLTQQAVNKKVNVDAIVTLGNISRTGSLGQKKDLPKALTLYTAGLINADQETGSNISFMIGQIYRDGGNGIKKDLQKAEDSFNKALTGTLSEQRKIETLYELGNLAIMRNNMQDAIEFHEQAEDQKIVPYVSAQAARVLGNIYANKGDLARAASYYKKAADQNIEPTARYLATKELAFLLFKGGTGLEKNIAESHKYALQGLKESVLPREAQGYRALLRLSRYKGQLPIAKL